MGESDPNKTNLSGMEVTGLSAGYTKNPSAKLIIKLLMRSSNKKAVRGRSVGLLVPINFVSNLVFGLGAAREMERIYVDCIIIV